MLVVWNEALVWTNIVVLKDDLSGHPHVLVAFNAAGEVASWASKGKTGSTAPEIGFHSSSVKDLSHTE